MWQAHTQMVPHMKDMERLFLFPRKSSVPTSLCFPACSHRFRWLKREGVPHFAPLEFTAPSPPPPPQHAWRERLGAMDLLAERSAEPRTP